MEKMQFLMVESYPRYIYCHGIKNPYYLFENLRLVSVESGERPNDLIDVLGHFSVILQPWNFYEVKFTDTFSAGKTECKNHKKYFILSALN